MLFTKQKFTSQYTYDKHHIVNKEMSLNKKCHIHHYIDNIQFYTLYRG